MAVVHIDLPFISSEIANPSHCEIINLSMWQTLFFSVVSEKKGRHFVTLQKSELCSYLKITVA